MIHGFDFNLADLILELCCWKFCHKWQNLLYPDVCLSEWFFTFILGRGPGGAIALWYCINDVAILLAHIYIARSKVQEFAECISNVIFLWEIYIYMRRTREEAGTRQDSTPSPQPARSLDNILICFGFRSHLQLWRGHLVVVLFTFQVNWKYFWWRFATLARLFDRTPNALRNIVVIWFKNGFAGSCNMIILWSTNIWKRHRLYIFCSPRYCDHFGYFCFRLTGAPLVCAN